jgi:hypothetical protein
MVDVLSEQAGADVKAARTAFDDDEARVRLLIFRFFSQVLTFFSIRSTL